MKYIIYILFTTFLFLDAKIIDIKQLFNKPIVKVKQKNITLTKDFYGYTKFDETSIVDINLRFDGFITKLYANKLYDKVQTQKPLLRIYSSEVNSLQEELKLSIANRYLYNNVINRLKNLDINDIVLTKFKKNHKLINDIEIYSPINGVIIEKNVYDKSFINRGQTIFKVANLDSLWVIARVYQQNIKFVFEGMKAKIFVEGYEESIQGVVDYIYPIVNSKTKTIDIRIVIDNKKYKLYPNMFIKVSLYKNKKSMLVLPKSSILIKGSKYYVFKPINNGYFEPLMIKARQINSNEFEILDNLKLGDEVIDKILFMLDSESITNGMYDLSNSSNDW